MHHYASAAQASSWEARAIAIVHILKVHDERLTPGEIKVAHIMKMFPQQATEETIASLKLSADSILSKVASGADFAELAKKYSDDKQSAVEGGVMPFFTPTNMVPDRKSVV